MLSKVIFRHFRGEKKQIRQFTIKPNKYSSDLPQDHTHRFPPAPQWGTDQLPENALRIPWAVRGWGCYTPSKSGAERHVFVFVSSLLLLLLLLLLMLLSFLLLSLPFLSSMVLLLLMVLVVVIVVLLRCVCVVGTLVLCPIVSDIRNDVNTNHKRNRTKNTPSPINFHLSSPQVAWTRITAGIPFLSSLSMELVQVEGCELTIFPSKKYKILGSKCHSIPKLQFILETPKLRKFMPAVFAAETAPPPPPPKHPLKMALSSSFVRSPRFPDT